MKASIYARESSDDTKKAPSIQEQIKIGTQWIKDNNHELVFIFQDNGFSGGDWKRPDWNNAITKAKGHFFQILWTWNQDRLARDTEQFLWFYRNLKESHIKVISGTEGEINMDDVGGMAKHTSLAMASEIFRRVTSEKVKRTYESKKKEAERKGEKFNWGRKAKSYDEVKIMNLRALGKGYKAIGKDLGYNYQTIRRIIQRFQNTHDKNTIKNDENKGVI